MSIRHTELLESRRLMSTTSIPNGNLDVYGGVLTTPDDAGPGAPAGGTMNTIARAPMTFSDGVLTVYGSPTDDQFHPVISRGRLSFELLRLAIPAGGTVLYDGTADGLSGLPIATLTDDQLPRLADVKKILVYAGDGNDTIDVKRLAIATEAHGGNGRDTIVGGAGDDTLYGESGNDQLTDGRGHDLLAGGAGNDLLRNLKGADTLLGQGGDDRLIAFADETAVNGGAGIDTAELIGTPDAVSGIEDYTAHSRRPATAINGQAGSITLSRTPGGLRLDATLTVRGTRYQMDWDLIETSGRIEAVATPYLIDPELATTLQLNSTFSHSFNLPANVERGNIIVSLRVSGNTVIRGRVRPTGSFTSQSFIKNDPDQATLVAL